MFWEKGLEFHEPHTGMSSFGLVLQDEYFTGWLKNRINLYLKIKKEGKDEKRAASITGELHRKIHKELMTTKGTSCSFYHGSEK